MAAARLFRSRALTGRRSVELNQSWSYLPSATIFRRPFSLSHIRCLSVGAAASPSSFCDPEPQTGLYYHPTVINVSDGKSESQVQAWALSYLDTPPQTEKESLVSVVAHLLPPKKPSSTSDSQEFHQQDPIQLVRSLPDRIRINDHAWKLLHSTLQNQVVPYDELLQFEAETRNSGWAHLTDLRHPLMPGRIATPENILSSVAFVDGILDPSTYEINRSYRLVTGYEGPLQMPENWIGKLRSSFQKAVKEQA